MHLDVFISAVYQDITKLQLYNVKYFLPLQLNNEYWLKVQTLSFNLSFYLLQK